jgi:hypothetical protein
MWLMLVLNAELQVQGPVDAPELPYKEFHFVVCIANN